MVWTDDQLAQVVSSGGGVIIDSDDFTIDQLKRIAYSTREKGATVIVRNCGSKSTDELKQIGSSGKGHVIFEL